MHVYHRAANWGVFRQKRFSLVDRVLSENSQRQAKSFDQRFGGLEPTQATAVCPDSAIIKAIGWSDRHFATCFRAQIGITPKRSTAYSIQPCSSTPKIITHSVRIRFAVIATKSHFVRNSVYFLGVLPRFTKSPFADLLGTQAISSICKRGQFYSRHNSTVFIMARS